MPHELSDYPTSSTTVLSLRSLRLVRSVCAWSVIAVGIIALAGWTLHKPALTSVVPGMISMKVNTAINLVVLAIALLLLGKQSPASRGGFWIGEGFVVSICAITACEYAFRKNLWIDTAFFVDPISQQFPGRMAPATLVCFLFLSGAFGFVQIRRATVVAQILLLITATAPLTTLGGYLYRAPSMYQAAPYPVIALNTATGLMLLCVGGLVASDSHGLVQLALSQSLAGRMFRRLLPSAVGVPLFVGFLVLGGERAGFYTTAFASAILVGSCALFFAIAVWWAASVLWKSEQALQTSKRAAELAREVAEEASRSKDLFLAVVSHELRTPLNPILVLASTLQQRVDLPDDVLEDVTVICRNVEIEARIVDDLLNLTRLERGKITLDQKAVDLHALLKQIVDELEPELVQKNVRVETQFAAAPQFIWADASRMRQVLSNLIGNAIKFSAQHGLVTISTGITSSDKIRVAITDHGIGIAPDVLPKLFRPFEQGAKSRTRQHGGLGLGLVIAKGIVDLHGGSITMHSDGNGKGATLVVELQAAPAAVIPPAKELNNQTTRSLESVAQGEVYRILLVEDDRDTLRTMSKILKSFGHRVLTAASVAEAAPLVEAGAFDLLVSDIGLPDGSGLDIVRSAHQRRPTKAIAISGFGQEDDIRQSKEAGFSAHLVKPVDFELLRATIARTTLFTG